MIEIKTTSHFLTPFLAGISYPLAHRLSRLVPHRYWRHPFGNLILFVATRKLVRGLCAELPREPNSAEQPSPGAGMFARAR